MTTRRVMHRLSKSRPMSSMPVCRVGATDRQMRAMRVTTLDRSVTCKRCLKLMQRSVEVAK